MSGVETETHAVFLTLCERINAEPQVSERNMALFICTPGGTS